MPVVGDMDVVDVRPSESKEIPRLLAGTSSTIKRWPGMKVCLLSERLALGKGRWLLDVDGSNKETL